jgi:hypothetical protein
MLMAAPEVQGINLFKIAGRSISGWVPSLKTGTVIRQPFYSQLAERLMLWLEYHPLIVNDAPSAKGTVESLFRWMTQRFEKRLPNSSYGVHDAETAAQGGGMTLGELERCFYRAIVDDSQRKFDPLRQQRRTSSGSKHTPLASSRLHRPRNVGRPQEKQTGVWLEDKR